MQAKNIINTINDPHVYLIINTMNSIDTSEQDLKEFNLNVKIFSEKYSLKINRVNLMKIHSNIENESSLIDYLFCAYKDFASSTHFLSYSSSR